MTSNPITVKPGDSVRHAREVIEKHRINQLPVVLDGRLVGIVTDRDLRDAFPSVFDHRRRTDASADPDTIPVEDVMSRTVLTLAPDDSIEDGVRLMRRERIGAIPVVDGRRLVGILTRSDVLDAFLSTSAAPRTRSCIGVMKLTCAGSRGIVLESERALFRPGQEETEWHEEEA